MTKYIRKIKHIRKIKRLNLSSMQTFTLVWFGQFISTMGTAMTRFALIIWAYTQMESATTTALLGFFSYMPYILMCPIAGVVVDRYDRKKILIGADLVAGLMTTTLLILFMTDQLQVWHLFLAEAVASAAEAFQIPAFSSTVSLLVPKENYTKASGMRSFSAYSASVLAPVLGSILVLFIGISGVMMIDVVTFVVAISIVLVVALPKIDSSKSKYLIEHHFKSNFKEGIQYLKKFKGLLQLMSLYVGMNFFASLTYFGILPAMILARSGSDHLALATVQSAIGVGGILGSVVVSLSKSPSSRVKAIILSGIGSFLFGDLLLSIGQNVTVWAVGAFLSSFFLPFMSSAYESLWQSKIEPSFQGRVFSVRDMIQMASMPIGFLLGGYLADHVFEPLMLHGSAFSSQLNWLLGSGKGTGMALMFLMTCILGTSACAMGFFSKNLLELESNTPDYTEVTECE